jgi:hypothetical protein
MLARARSANRSSVFSAWTCAIVVALFADSAYGQLTMTISNPTISGQPGEIITLNGTLTATADIPLIPGTTPSQLASSVLTLGVNQVTVSSLAMNATCTGLIVNAQISPSAATGAYPTNSFRLSFDDADGRTGLTSAVNLPVTVVGPPGTPLPPTLVLVLAGVAALGLHEICRRRRKPALG